WTQPRLPQGVMHMVGPLKDSATERRLIQAAAAQDMRVCGLIDFYTHSPSEGALVFGFAAYTPDEIVKFIKKLSCIYDSLPVPG
ncbi:PLP-dependent aminotransferase family protein, partial [Serratia quinivorans]